MIILKKQFFFFFKDKKILYIDNKGNKTQYELKPNEEFCDFVCKDSKINKRIKYAIKEILK